ncbi:MAG: pectate lyase [Paludibacter sp.]|jgi:hypothetical protein|nr:pectate lyase [Paludibacter sp.]
MSKYLNFLLLLAFSFLSLSCDPPVDEPENNDPEIEEQQIKTYPTPLRDTVPAFPGAQGGAQFITGGAGGDVYVVNKLEDSYSEGTLRTALGKTGRRTIVFAVSGVIELVYGKISINNGDVTVAGQTAPGDGIVIANYPIQVNADNVILRFLRFRMGDVTKTEDDALNGRNRKNIMIDHCSMSWSTDECSSFYDNENFTMQWCIVSESLRNSVHGKGAHGYGGIWGGKKASFHHNLLAHHDSRNPRFCGSRYSNKPEEEKVDFRYNVIYNWRSNSAYAGEGGSYNMVNNYYKPGPATYSRGTNSLTYRIFQPNPDDGTNNQPKGVYGRFYVAGNVMDNKLATAPDVTADNWLGVHYSLSAMPELRQENEFKFFTFEPKTAEQAYNDVLLKAGASFKRDTIDARIVREVREGSFTFTGSNGSTLGLIDTQTDVGGWPVYSFIPENVPVDTDKDGMPDAWEEEKGLNKNDKTDAAKYNLSPSYTNIEVYFNGLVKHLY